MMPFDVLFPEIAEKEGRALQPVNVRDVPKGTFLFREHYCTEHNCDCRRALVQIWWVERRRVVATINYGFEPPKPPHKDEPRMFLDPVNAQTRLSQTLFDVFKSMIKHDPEYHKRLVRHYAMWKAVVDDPTHPDHPKVRNETHDDPDFRPAFPKRLEPDRRVEFKIGRNDPCPCGSGKKHKRCCGA